MKMLKLLVLYGHPTDPAAFERYYADVHMPIAAQIEGVKLELGKVIGTPDGGKAPFYRMAQVAFDNADHMQAVLATPAAQRTVADLANFATGGVTIMVAEVT
jgi:uncharacterized protein (TIGR02118 family)